MISALTFGELYPEIKFEVDSSFKRIQIANT